MSKANSAGDQLQDYQLVEKFTAGFVSKLRQDEVDPGSAVEGSYNFILDDDGKWRTRPGTQYLGRISSDTYPITSCGIVRRRDGVQVPYIFYNTVADYYSPEKGDWSRLMTGLTADAPWGSDAFDLTTDNVNKNALCNGYDTYRTWSAVTALFASATGTTIVVSGSTTLANLGFTATGSLIVDEIAYAYTGISGQTFTGVSPDPTLGGHSTTSAIAQSVASYPSAPKGNVFLSAPNARMLVGSIIPSSSIYGGGQVRGSKTNDPTDFSFSGTRLPNEGFSVTIPEGGDTIRGAAVFEGQCLFFKKYAITPLTFSTDGNDNPILGQPIIPYDNKASGDIGSVSSRGVFRLGQEVFFVSPNNVISSIKRVQGYDFPLPYSYSDPIKKTVDSYVFDEQTAGVGWRGRAFFAEKSGSDTATNDRLLTYNSRYTCWDTPWVGLGFNDFFEKDSYLYGCLNTAPNVVKLWTGYTDLKSDSDAGFPINAKLVLPRLTYGKRAQFKQFQKYFVHGEMFQTGTATFTITYMTANGRQSRTVTVAGTESGFFVVSSASTLGDDPFGDQVFGGGGMGASADEPQEMRLFLTTTKLNNYDIQLTIETPSYFKLFAYGPSISMSNFVSSPTGNKAIN